VEFAGHGVEAVLDDSEAPGGEQPYARLGWGVGDSATEAFWQQFMGSLRDRGLSGVQLVISDAHRVLAVACDRWFQGAARQRCRVHFIRNLLAAVPRTHQHMADAVFRTIFAQPDAVADAWDQVTDQLAARFAKIGPIMAAAKTEVLAFAAFPRAHWQKICSPTPSIASTNSSRCWNWATGGRRRLPYEPRARTLFDNALARGHTRREAMRILKRHLAPQTPRLGLTPQRLHCPLSQPPIELAHR
jgi:transposase-like protein